MSDMSSKAAAYTDRTRARTMGPLRDVGVIAGVTGMDRAAGSFVKIDIGLHHA